jgi:5-methyltetrahydrofolate--homocysteine methyltransferase
MAFRDIQERLTRSKRVDEFILLDIEEARLAATKPIEVMKLT